MASLVEYGSSDEEESGQHVTLDEHRASSLTPYIAPEDTRVEYESKTSGGWSAPDVSQVQSDDLNDHIQNATSSAFKVDGEKSSMTDPLGPLNDPFAGRHSSSYSRSISPFSSDRAALRTLTMPQYANLDIPPSPPGSPSTIMEARVSRFLNLKREDVHFNAKLASSVALNNPSLLLKLMRSAGLSDGSVQYATSLDPDSWRLDTFPSDAFVEGIERSQNLLLRQKQSDRLEKGRDFVKASQE